MALNVSRSDTPLKRCPFKSAATIMPRLGNTQSSTRRDKTFICSLFFFFFHSRIDRRRTSRFPSFFLLCVLQQTPKQQNQLVCVKRPDVSTVLSTTRFEVCGRAHAKGSRNAPSQQAIRTKPPPKGARKEQSSRFHAPIRQSASQPCLAASRIALL